MSNKLPSKSQHGFTLVELIVVIVILGILSAVALPRFINVTNDARTGAVKGFMGGVTSGAVLPQAKWFVTGATSATVTMADGVVVAVSSATGLPTGTSAGIGTAIRCNDTDCNGVTANYSNPAAVTFTLDGAPTPANCRVTYNANTGAVSAATTCN